MNLMGVKQKLAEKILMTLVLVFIILDLNIRKKLQNAMK